MPSSSIQNNFLGQPLNMTQTFYQKKLSPNGSGIEDLKASDRPPSIDPKLFRNSDDVIENDVEN